MTDREKAKKMRSLVTRLSKVADEMDQLGQKTNADHLDLIIGDLHYEIDFLVNGQPPPENLRGLYRI